MIAGPRRMERLLTRLTGSRRALLSRVRETAPDLRDRPPAAGAWSLLQVVEHLVIAEQLTLEQLRAPRAPSRMGPAWQATLRLRMIYILFASPARVRAPSAALLPSGGLTLDPLEGRWQAAATGIAEWVRTLDDAGRRARPFRHPVCGWLRADQMLAFHDSHVRHHRRQVERIRRSLARAGA